MMSKSCTPQSRYIPPDTATYSGGRRLGVQGGGADGVDPAQLAAVDRRLGRGDRGVVAALEPDLHRHRRALQAAEQLGALRAVGPHRLLAERRQARLDAGEDELRVGVRAGRDDHAVDARAEQGVQRVDALDTLGAEPLDDRLGLLRNEVGDHQRVDRGDPDQGVRCGTPRSGRGPMSPSRMLCRTFLVAEESEGSGSGGDARGAHPVRVGHRGRLPAGEDVDDALRGVGEGQLRSRAGSAPSGAG